MLVRSRIFKAYMVYDSASMSKAGCIDQYANLVSSKTQYLLKQSPVSLQKSLVHAIQCMHPLEPTIKRMNDRLP
jgi:hypothetical protein